MIRAGFGTETAADTGTLIDTGNAVCDADSILGTDLGAVSHADTAIAAAAFAAIEQFYSLTALQSLIIHFIFCSGTVAGTVYYRNLFDDIGKFYS